MKIFYKSLIIILIFGNIFAQGISTRQMRTASLERICGTAYFSNDKIEKAIENTEINNFESYNEALGKRTEKFKTFSIGQQSEFYVYNFIKHSFEKITAELKVSGNSTEIWVQVSEITNGHVPTDVPNKLLENLENKTPSGSKNPSKGIKLLNEEFFGLPPNMGPNGKGTGNGKVVFLVYDIQDGWTINSQSYIAGFFIGSDQLKKSDYPFSNQRDILYIDSYPGITYPDRNGNNQTDPTRPLPVVAHEYQHLIHYNYDPNEEVFINEGMSEYATYVCGYGFSDPSGYLQNTDVPLFHWGDLTDPNTLNDYDRARLWTLYLSQQVGDSVLKKIVKSSKKEINGINEELSAVGSPLRFDDIFFNWTIANYLNDVSFDKKYGYKDNDKLSIPRASGIDITDPVYSSKNEEVGALAVDYIKYRSLDAISIKFSTGDSVVIKAIEVGKTKIIKDVSSGIFFEEENLGSVYNEITFAVINLKRTSKETYQYFSEGIKHETFVEIGYDNGIQETFINVTGGKGFAVKFVPSYSQNRLTKARLYVAFGQEFSNSTVPQNAPKDFIFHIWKDNNGIPGVSLFDSLISTNRSSFPGTFIDIDLSNYSSLLSNLGTTWIGFIDNDEYNTAVGIHRNSANREYSLVTGGNNKWVSLWNLSNSLNGYNVMFRTEWAYKGIIQTPGSYELYQNYPNPFILKSNANTTIRIKMDKPGRAVIRIYNILGQEVKTLFDGEMKRIFNEVSWDGTNNNGYKVSSGIYFYKVFAGGKVEVKKMILLR